MPKSSGLGDNLYVDGYNLSGDIGSLGSIHGGPAPLVVTGIDKSGYERIGGKRDGGIDYTAFFNPGLGASAHPVLSLLPTGDTFMTYCRGTTLGAPAACLEAKQVGYDPKRGQDGSLIFDVSAVCDGFGLEWGVQLTAGTRTDTGANTGSATQFDALTPGTNGCQIYIQVFSLTGADATITVKSSSDGAGFTAPQTEATLAVPGRTAVRLVGANANVNRYWRVITTTTGGFTSLPFSVVLVKNDTAVTF